MRIYHGSIVTCDRQNRVFAYLVEKNGRIFHVGDELPAEIARAGERVELGERALLPCFGDAHLHFSNWALVATVFFDPREAKDFEELGQMLRDFSRQDRSSKILTGFGLSQHSLEEKRLITREELDGFERDRPVYLICYDGHSAVINSRMLEIG